MSWCEWDIYYGYIVLVINDVVNVMAAYLHGRGRNFDINTQFILK